MIKKIIIILLLFSVISYPVYGSEVILDKDKDGFPDKAELLKYFDRSNFRLWFTYIALSQYYYPSPLWNEREKDCAGLIRFSYKEALKKHDDKWLEDMPYLSNIGIPDVSSFNYPYIPILKTYLFRIAPGPFTSDELNNIERFFSPYADTYNLIKYNMVKIGRQDRVAKKGDILVFYNPYDPDMPFHTMIFIGRDVFRDPYGPRDWLIYHTGPREKDEGVIKKIRRELLRHHKNPKWRPIPENPFFLGYFRFKILDYREDIK